MMTQPPHARWHCRVKQAAGNLTASDCTHHIAAVLSMWSCTMQGTDPAGFLIEYGSGVVAGSVAFDTVAVGEPAITLHSQGIGLAAATTSAFVSASCDGLFVRPITICHCTSTQSGSAQNPTVLDGVILQGLIGSPG